MSMPSRRHLLLAILLLGSVGFFIYSLRGGQVAREQISRPLQETATTPTTRERDIQPAAPPDVDFSRYAALAGNNVFSENRALSKPEKSAPSGKVEPPPPLPSGENSKPVTPEVDFSGWSYAGYVELNGEQLGILQNDATRACKYVGQGDNFMGATVEDIDRESISFRSGSSKKSLSRPRDFPITPLEKGAG